MFFVSKDNLYTFSFNFPAPGVKCLGTTVSSLAVLNHSAVFHFYFSRHHFVRSGILGTRVPLSRRYGTYATLQTALLPYEGSQ